MKDATRIEIATSNLQEALGHTAEFVAQIKDDTRNNGSVDYATLSGGLEGWINILEIRMQGILAVLTMEAEDK